MTRLARAPMSASVARASGAMVYAPWEAMDWPGAAPR
jgi:hypothetical protein